MPKHRKVQVENYVAVSYNNRNFDSAKRAAKELTEDFGLKVCKSKQDGDLYKFDGFFCVDEGCYCEKAKVCLFCGCFNSGNLCACCDVDVLNEM